MTTDIATTHRPPSQMHGGAGRTLPSRSPGVATFTHGDSPPLSGRAPCGLVLVLRLTLSTVLLSCLRLTVVPLVLALVLR